MLEDERRREEEARDGGLKYDRSGKILLVPQPSDDPNDPLVCTCFVPSSPLTTSTPYVHPQRNDTNDFSPPLQNWPLWHRDLITLVLSLTSVIASTLSPLLAADTVSLAIYFHRSFTSMALLTGYHLLGVALAGFLFVPSARIWGKRHVYLLGALIIVVSSAWGGASGRSYKSLLWARIFQGVGLAPFEALVNASVGDMYCVHERGVRMALSNLALFGGAFATPVVVGKMASEMGYEWTFWFVAIFTGGMVPLLVFWCPETTYVREQRFEIDTMGNLIRGEEGVKGEGEKTPSAERDATSLPPPEKHSYLYSLRPFNGRHTPSRYLTLLLRPFPLFLHPGILWACLIQGALIGWTVMIGVVLAAIMLGPPLWFGEEKTGYMYTGAFIGALVGFALCGLVSDWSARVLTRWNHGVYEPEFRMVLVVPQMVLGCAGLYGFGVASADPARYGWVWPDFFFALEVAGMVCGAVASALYIVDAHREYLLFSFIIGRLFVCGVWIGGADVDAQGTCRSRASPASSCSRTSSPSPLRSRGLSGFSRGRSSLFSRLWRACRWGFAC